MIRLRVGMNCYRLGWLFVAAVAMALWLPSAALAHTGGSVLGGFVSGFSHPIRGPDHFLAMLAVGIWGAQIGGRSVWMLPVVFPLIMAIGGFLGVVGLEVTHVELAVGLSVLVLGLAVLAAWQAPEWLAIIVVGAFAVYHGYAHGSELPRAADPVAYGLGFVAATGLIHVAGIGFGLVLGRMAGGWVSRAAGGAIALAGVYFLAG